MMDEIKKNQLKKDLKQIKIKKIKDKFNIKIKWQDLLLFWREWCGDRWEEREKREEDENK